MAFLGPDSIIEDMSVLIKEDVTRSSGLICAVTLEKMGETLYLL